jgi:electron transfer flavoprotein alpha/beta subunit
MKIVCLVKQVPRVDAIEFDEETKQLKREGVPLLLNPFDARSVAHAARLGGDVVAMTMGPPQAEEALRECLALGADRCIHLSDRVFAVADTIGTSRTLAMAIEKEGGADLVLCGLKALDAETRQVPPEVAAYLGWPHITDVLELKPADRKLRARRATDDGEETVEVPLPAVCSISGSIEADRGSAAGPVAVWTAADLVDDVQENDKRFGQPGSPTRVLAVRDVTPERAGERFGSAREAAQRIAALLAERPPTATSWEKPARLGETPGKAYDCWTLVELRDGRATRTSLELLGKGRELAGKLGGQNVALILGEGGDEVAEAGAEVVVRVDDERLRDADAEVFAAALAQVLSSERPHVLLIPATAWGRDVGPRAAGQLELGMTADCVDLGIDRAGRLIQHKPAYGGNIVSVIMGSTTPQLATVRPRMFEPLQPGRTGQARLRSLSLDGLPKPRARVLERHPEPRWTLDEADVVVAFGSKVDRGGVERLVELLGAAVGTDDQIGLLGRAVAPRLYLAIETRADSEHLAGSVKAAVIAAISADEGSELLRAADVGIGGDWREVLPALADELSGTI